MKTPLEVVRARTACLEGVKWVQARPHLTAGEIFDEATREGAEVAKALCFFSIKYNTVSQEQCPGHGTERTPEVLEQIAKLRAAFVKECEG